MSISFPKGNAERLKHFKIEIDKMLDFEIEWRQMIEECQTHLAEGDFVGKRSVVLRYLLNRLKTVPIINLSSRAWTDMTKDLYDRGLISLEVIKEPDNSSGHNLAGEGTIVLYTIETSKFICYKHSFCYTDWTVQIRSFENLCNDLLQGIKQIRRILRVNDLKAGESKVKASNNPFIRLVILAKKDGNIPALLEAIKNLNQKTTIETINKLNLDISMNAISP